MKSFFPLGVCGLVLVLQTFCGCKTPLRIPSIEVALLRSPISTEDLIEVSGVNYPASTPLTIEGFTTSSPRTIGSVVSDAQGSFKTKVSLSCVSASQQIITVQVYPVNGGTKAFAKTDRPVCF